MKREEIYYLSADKKTKIHAVEWKPEGEIKGIIQIIHGVTEHILRYEECAKFFTELSSEYNNSTFDGKLVKQV